MNTRQTDGKYNGYRDGDPLICVDCGTRKPQVEGPGEDGICASAHNGDAVCDACEDIRIEHLRKALAALHNIQNDRRVAVAKHTRNS